MRASCQSLSRIYPKRRGASSLKLKIPEQQLSARPGLCDRDCRFSAGLAGRNPHALGTRFVSFDDNGCVFMFVGIEELEVIVGRLPQY